MWNLAQQGSPWLDTRYEVFRIWNSKHQGVITKKNMVMKSYCNDESYQQAIELI